MPTLDDIRVIVAVVATGCGVIAFGLYVAASFGRLKTDPGDHLQSTTKALVASPSVTATDIASVVESLAKLADSLAKAGPALWSMLGSALFLLIAALSGGVLVGGGGAAGSQSPAPQSSEPTPQGHRGGGTSTPAVSENLPVRH